MGRPPKAETSGNLPSHPEKAARDRRKTLAISRGILSTTPSKSESLLGPSRTVLKHRGKDVIKKSQRKNRFLFAFPGMIGPVGGGGGRIGELKDLGTKNPILYLEFPQGQMKLFGTIVYPKNRYLTLQFSKGGKNVMCEDYFDAMIVFSDAWWIGKKEENPEESRLEFPKELTGGQHAECDFTGGAGATLQNRPSSSKTIMKNDKMPIPEAEQDCNSSDTEINLTEVAEITPVRQSKRTARNSIKYTETSSGHESIESDADGVDAEKEKVSLDEVSYQEDLLKNIQIMPFQKEYPDYEQLPKQAGRNFSTFAEVVNVDNKIEWDEGRTASAEKSNKQSISSRTKPNGTPRTNNGSLVQARISTMFKKVEDNVCAMFP